MYNITKRLKSVLQNCGSGLKKAEVRYNRCDSKIHLGSLRCNVLVSVLRGVVLDVLYSCDNWKLLFKQKGSFCIWERGF